ncbi:MAG TPA: hypothetical protein PK250_18520 [Syntrophobacter fumaroxidans]|nr:hypothetical protein [Syntrophobacter fumaroxidans]
MSLERRVEKLEASHGRVLILVAGNAEEAARLQEAHPEPKTLVVITGVGRTPNDPTERSEHDLN